MIHIVFSSSAAGTLRQLLRRRGLREQVVDLTDSLDWGPIATSLKERENWLNQNAPTGFGNCDWISKHVSEFWRACERDTERLIWIAPHSAAEQAGLYWFLSQLDGIEADMVIADYPLSASWKNQAPLGLGQLNEDMMAELFDGCARVRRDDRRFPSSRWSELMIENAYLRIVDGGAIQSVHESYFDDLLLEHCPSHDINWRRVVGHTMAASFDSRRSPDNEFLFWRLRELVRQGLIICDGELQLLSTGDRAAKVRRAT